MSFSIASTSAGGSSRTDSRALEFGRTYVVRPKGKHLATVVWLHGLADNGSSWSQILEKLHLPNIKWICPTAPTRRVTAFGGFPLSSCKMSCSSFRRHSRGYGGYGCRAAHVANLMSTEPADVKLGVGGFNTGAAAALYSATCFISGQYANGNTYPANLSAVVGLSGWLPCPKRLSDRIGGLEENVRHVASLPILLCHGMGDEVIPFKIGEKSSEALIASGFNVSFNPYYWSMKCVLGSFQRWGWRGPHDDKTWKVIRRTSM